MRVNQYLKGMHSVVALDRDFSMYMSVKEVVFSPYLSLGSKVTTENEYRKPGTQYFR